METTNEEQYHHWKEKEKIITSPDETADTFADHYTIISKEKQKKEERTTAILHRQRTENSHKITHKYST